MNFGNRAAAVLLPALMLAAAPMVQAQDDSDTRHHGYEHGYRDGFNYGRDAKAHGVALNAEGDAYQRADHGYREEFGPKEDYRTGYREGYRMGADDGFAGVSTRLEKLFGEGDYRPNLRWGYQDVASEIGYRDGIASGIKDLRERHSFRPTEHDQWKDGDHGYDKALGVKEAYQREYRLAYEEGYRDGYGGHLNP
jgi:hypothetical protein